MNKHTFLAALALAGCSKGASAAGESCEKLTFDRPASVTLDRGGSAKE